MEQFARHQGADAPSPAAVLIVDHLDEQFPLAPLDDFLIHQTPDPIRVAYSTDPRFFERYWNVFHDETGDLMLAIGGSFYPNLNKAESYAIVNHRGRQKSVRAFRALGVDRTQLTVGPIRPRIVEGLRSWHHGLDEGEWGFSYELDWTDTHRQIYDASYGSLSSGTPAGGQRQVTAGFEGFGVVSGWIAVDGVRVEWPSGAARGTRDRHWGIGRAVGGPALNDGRPVRAGWKGGVWISFDDVAFWGNRVLYGFDDTRPGASRIVAVQRRMRFEPDTKIFLEGIIEFTLAGGQKREIHVERLGFQTAYMRCGFYGGTPEDGLHHGEYSGPDRVEFDEYDVTRPEVRSRLSALNEHHCRVTYEGRTTTGILQPLEPEAYESCLRNDPGWSLLG
ncbi:hypothetical protein BH09ACT6_BH09ACT6_07020 [soil metagenome]